MPPPGVARTPLSGIVTWLTSLGRGKPTKTNNAAEKPVDVAAASMRGAGGIYWHVFGTRVSVDPGLFTACLKLGGSAEFITGWQCLIRSIDFALHRRMFEEANAV